MTTRAQEDAPRLLRRPVLSRLCPGRPLRPGDDGNDRGGTGSPRIPKPGQGMPDRPTRIARDLGGEFPRPTPTSSKPGISAGQMESAGSLFDLRDLPLIPLRDYLTRHGFFIGDNEVKLTPPVSHGDHLTIQLPSYLRPSSDHNRDASQSGRVVVAAATSLFCDVCGIMVPDAPAMARHIATRAHQSSQNIAAASQVSTTQDSFRVWKCLVCPGVEIVDPAGVEPHLQGKKHRARLKRKETDPAQENRTTPGCRRCDLCQVPVSGEDAWRSHINGRLHTRRVMESKPESKRLRAVVSGPPD